MENVTFFFYIQTVLTCIQQAGTRDSRISVDSRQVCRLKRNRNAGSTPFFPFVLHRTCTLHGKKITIIQQPSPLGRLNLRVHIEKHTSVVKSGIKNWITNQIKIIAVNIIAFDQYCVSFSPSGSSFPTRSECQRWLKSY